MGKWRKRAKRAAERAAEIERFAQLRQAGFVDVDKWGWGEFGMNTAEAQQQLLLAAVLRDAPQTTLLE